MEQFLDIIKNPSLAGILAVFISAGIMLLYNQGRRIFHSIRLLEYKQTATKHALGESLGSGFLESYNRKLEELKSDNKFIAKGE